MKKKYNTPHRCHVVKTRMTEEEYADFTERLKHYDMSQAEFIRQAITRATIRPIVTVSPVNDELLSAVGRLTAEYGRIGGNLNQIARFLNEYGTPYNCLLYTSDKFGLAHVIVFQPLGKVGVFFLGHAGFDHMTAVGRVVFFLQALISFLARQGA